MRWVAGILAAAALVWTAFHLVTPRLAGNERTLPIARKYLIQSKQSSDFNFLSANPVWRGKRLKHLLEHVALAHYNRGLVGWKLDDAIYRDFVLSPQIDPAFDGDMNWRRPLWESFYPRVRKESSLEAAAEIVMRHLRERLTIAEGENWPSDVVVIWQRHITNARGFEVIQVAALRSAGVPARLTGGHQTEFFTGTEWKLAPRPLL